MLFQTRMRVNSIVLYLVYNFDDTLLSLTIMICIILVAGHGVVLEKEIQVRCVE